MNPDSCCYENWGRVGRRGLDEGKKTISGWWEWFSFTSKDLHPLPITLCLKLNGKGTQVPETAGNHGSQKDWNFLLFYQQYENVFMKLPSNTGTVVWTLERSWCTVRNQRTVPTFPLQRHHIITQLHYLGLVPLCAASFPWESLKDLIPSLSRAGML